MTLRDRKITDQYHYYINERLIFDRIALIVEGHLSMEQASFRSAKSCTSQLLNLTLHIYSSIVHAVARVVELAAL